MNTFSSCATSSTVLVAQPGPECRLVSLTQPNGLAAEKFRVLATRLAHLSTAQRIRTIQVTSPVNGDGKSMVSANLAIALARNSAVVLLEGDLRKPVLSSLLGIATTAGLAEWWQSGGKAIDGYLHAISGTNLSFLSAGFAQRVAEPLQSNAIRELLARLAERFEWTIVDTPPMLPMADANLWARLVDGTLLVVREGWTPRKALQEGLQALDGPNLLGLVLNDASEADRGHYYARYYGKKGKTANDAVAAPEVERP